MCMDNPNFAKYNCDGSLASKPIKILLPEDGFHKGVLWAGLAENWAHQVSARISDGKFVSHQWSGTLINSSQN